MNDKKSPSVKARGNRRERPDIVAVTTATMTVELGPGQWWCSTAQAYEIWQKVDGLDRMAKRIPARRVYWVHQKENDNDQQ